jgi:hypothetical protein
MVKIIFARTLWYFSVHASIAIEKRQVRKKLFDQKSPARQQNVADESTRKTACGFQSSEKYWGISCYD